MKRTISAIIVLLGSVVCSNVTECRTQKKAPAAEKPAPTAPRLPGKIMASSCSQYELEHEDYEQVCDNIPIVAPPQWQIWCATVGSRLYVNCLSLKKQANTCLGQAKTWANTCWANLSQKMKSPKQYLLAVRRAKNNTENVYNAPHQRT